MSRLIDSVITAPIGRFREFMREIFLRYRNPLDALNEILASVESLEDGTLLVELGNGIRFYAPSDGVQDKMTSFLIRYRNRHILNQVVGADNYGIFWRELMEQWVDDAYQEYYKIKKGDVVVDLGAHIGTFTVRAATTVGDQGIVVAVEPDIDNLMFVERNIKENGLANVIVVPKGAWSRKEMLKLFLSQHSSRHSFLWEKSAFREVEADAVDNILKELGIKKVDFIKMDIEGAEIEALKGMKETFNNNNVQLAISAYHTVGEKKTYKAVCSWLNEHGFQVHTKKDMVYAQKSDL